MRAKTLSIPLQYPDCENRKPGRNRGGKKGAKRDTEKTRGVENAASALRERILGSGERQKKIRLGEIVDVEQENYTRQMSPRCNISEPPHAREDAPTNALWRHRWGKMTKRTTLGQDGEVMRRERRGGPPFHEPTVMYVGAPINSNIIT